MRKTQIAAITGNIGSGKSTVCDIMLQNGYPVFGSDRFIQILYAHDTGFLKFILETAPECVISEAKIDKSKIYEKFHRDAAFADTLEKHLYQKLDSLRKIFLSIAEAEKRSLIFCEVPLLFEKNMQDAYDFTVTVYADEAIRKARVLQRKNFDAEKFNYLNALQTPSDIQKERSDYALCNENDLEGLKEAIKKLIAEMERRKI